MLQNTPSRHRRDGRGWMQRFQKPDTPDIFVRQPHFRRGWKVSAIREALPCWGGELHSFRFKGLFGQIRHPIIGSKDPNLHSQLLFDKVTSLVNDLIRDMAFTRIQVYIFHVFIQFPQRPPSQKSVEYPENNWDTSSSLYLVVSISTILKDAFFWATFKVFLNFWSNSWSDSSCSWRWSQ